MCAMSPRLLRPIAGGVHPEAAAWRSAVIANGGNVSGSTLDAVSKFCRSIDAAGIRDRFYRLNLFAGTLGSSIATSGVVVPLYRGPSLSGTQYGNTTDTPNVFAITDYAETGASGGLTGNGTSKYLNTGFSPSLLPDFKYGHMATWNVNFPEIHTGSRWLMGCRNNGSPAFNFFWLNVQLNPVSPTNEYRRVAWSSGFVPTATSETGDVLFAVSRDSGGDAFGYENEQKTALGSLLTASTPDAIYVFAHNAAGTAEGFYDRAIAAYSIGDSMTEAQMGTYRSILSTFMASLGRVST